MLKRHFTHLVDKAERRITQVPSLSGTQRYIFCDDCYAKCIKNEMFEK